MLLIIKVRVSPYVGITYTGIPVQLNTLLTSLGSTQPWSNYC